MSVVDLALGGVSYRSLRVWQRNRDVFLRFWGAELVAPALEPLIFLVAMGVGLGAYVELGGDQEYIQFLVPGMLAIFPMFAAVGECLWGSYFRMERQGTYHAMIATPVNIEDVIGGEILWGSTRLMLSTTFVLAVTLLFAPFYDLFQSPLILLVLPASLVTGVLFSAVTLSYTSVAFSISSLNYFFTLFITPTFWFSGAFFPIERLPDVLRVVSWFIPTTHVVNLYRALVEGSLSWSELGDLAWLLVVGAVFFGVAVRSMRRRLIV
jgi:lipooligosaccharide transport system permease protein